MHSTRTLDVFLSHEEFMPPTIPAKLITSLLLKKTKSSFAKVISSPEVLNLVVDFNFSKKISLPILEKS